MLTTEALQEMLADIESDRVERTISVSDTDKFGEAICAFANDLPHHQRPGYLIIGANNVGLPQRVEITDQLLQNLGALRSDGNIIPLPVLTVERRSLPSGDVAVVSVQPSDLPPVRYKGRVWIRVGPRRAVASEQDERLLSEKRLSSAKSFDARPNRESKIEDLALGQFEAFRQEAVSPEIIAENHRSMTEQLASLRFFNPTFACPTNAGLLLFAKNPRYFFSGAYVQYLQFIGKDLNDLPTDQAEISGDMVTVLREIETRIKGIIKTSIRPSAGLKETIASDYPLLALRELVVNALVHRNYESNTPVRLYFFADRIEIYSPGGLFGEATAENFPKRSSYRNPILADAMKVLGYVNRFGYGIQRAQKILNDNGNPPVEFVIETHTVLAIVRGRHD